ncbi:MAG: discoidin domain-containing protein [Luteolibacter sp.]
MSPKASLRHTILAALATILPAAAETTDAPFINNWLVCGPFANAPEVSNAKPDTGNPLGDKKWEFLDDRLWNRNYENYQDLSGYYAVKKGIDTRNQYVLARSYIFSPGDQAAEFRFGNSGTSRLFVNGTEVHKEATPKEVQRDMYKQLVTLKKGWNRILVEVRHDFTADTNANGAEIAKDAAVSYLGLYGRISDTGGNAVPGVLYSVAGDTSRELTIDTQALAATDVVADSTAKGRGLPSNVLPIGYVEWPYVWNKSLYGRDSRRIWADAYRFQASGGQPGYQFEIAGGALPDGLTLKPDGSLDGFCEKTGSFDFTLQVKDGAGRTARKNLSILIKDRPNRKFEEGRVGALSHCIAVYPFWVDPNFSADLWAERAKREGHSFISIEALQQNYYWPSQFEDPKHPRNQFQPRDKDGKVPDGLKPFADAAKRYGITFGLYYATEGGGLGHHSTDVFVQNCSDLIRRYDARYLYFDGPQTMPGANYDVMYSNVRNYGDDIIINSNVWAGHGEFGDADLGTSEASHIYSGAEAARYTKRIVVEPWKSAHTKNNPTPYYAKRDDFRQVAKEMVMNAARGFVDNNDQMPLMSRGPNWDSPADIANRYPKSIQEFSDLREGLAGWFAQPGKPELHESTTGTMPYFLAGCGYDDDGKGNIDSFAHGKGPAWGYATARDNNIYLHFIKGPDGKKGYTGETSVTINPVKHRVQQVAWLNENKLLKFQQSGESLTITLEDITADPVDSIIKITTDNPARKYRLTNIVATGKQLSPSTLQVEAEGYATYPALKVPFAQGDIHFASDNPSVATVDVNGMVTAIAPGKAVISAEDVHEAPHKAASPKGPLSVIVDSARKLRVDDTMIGAVLKVSGREAFLSCSGTGELPFTLEGRSEKGGPISLHTAKVSFKSGVVDYAKGTQKQPVFIEEKPAATFTNKSLNAKQVEELTRIAVWAEVDLDGTKVTTNKVFLDLEPRVPVDLTGAKVASSGNLTDFSPDKAIDGVTHTLDGSDRSKWSADGKQPSWLAFDLKSPQKVSLVSIHFNTLDQAYINTPETMEVQASADGRQWTTLGTFSPPAQGSGAYYGFPCDFRFKPVTTRYLRLSFPKGNPKGEAVDLLEVNFYQGIVNNLAVLAKFSASSEFNESYAASNVADGVVGETGRGEWASKGEADPWIKMEWQDKVSVNRIVLRDRPNGSDNIQQGILTLSDGSSIKVTDMSNDGSPKTIEFPAKSIQWLKFEATGNKPGNNGLSEISVFGPK